jgi:hypothetical protein
MIAQADLEALLKDIRFDTHSAGWKAKWQCQEKSGQVAAIYLLKQRKQAQVPQGTNTGYHSAASLRPYHSCLKFDLHQMQPARSSRHHSSSILISSTCRKTSLIAMPLAKMQ